MSHPQIPMQSPRHQVAYRLSRLLGLTTGVGVMAWGASSLALTVAMAVWDEDGAGQVAIVSGDAFNQGVLQSAMLVALGVVILELRRIGDALESNRSK